MKKITRLLLMTAIAIGMVACSNDDNLPDAPDANAAKGNTYASISIKLPNSPSTRAALTETWEGLDAIKTITVFLVNTEATTPSVDHKTFTEASFEGVDSQGILFPKLALKATAADKVKAYVVLNGNTDVLTTLEGAEAADFAKKYNDVISKIASKLAKNEAGKDVIMMTNTDAPAEMTVKAGVTESEAMTGSGNNTFMVNVERVVSRAIVTVNDGATLKVDVQNAKKENKSTITIKDLKYVVGQSNKEFFLTKKKDWTTPAAVYDFVPTAENWMAAVKGEEAKFDNEGLSNSATVQETTGGKELANFKNALEAEKSNSKFVLPVTHADANYRKGNTTFFEVIATFTPDKVDGDGTYSPGSDVFMGMKDGKFYTSRELAEAEGQKATHYKGDKSTGAIMKYVLWLNPNKIPGATGDKATMSPTVRNQVYHAHIKGFKQIGLPNNPLNPDDPNNPQPKDPTDPGYDPTDPWKPKDPTDPGYDPNNPGNENPRNPIKPEDPLQTDDTYLSVQITVVPWGIHSYEIDLGNDY